MRKLLMTALSMVAVAIVVPSLTGCSDDEFEGNEEFTPIELTTSQTRGVTEANNFAIDFTKQLYIESAEENVNDNIFNSPVSLAYVLSMIANGAEGETRDEILQALGTDDLSNLNDFCNILSTKITKADRKVKLAFANSMWVDKSLSIKSSFQSTLKDKFNCEYYKVDDITTDDTRKKINKWGSDKTNGLIPEFLKGNIPYKESLAILNSTYFKGEWETPFKAKNTKSAPFYNADGTKSIVKMMHLNETIQGFARESFIAAELLYGNGAFGMALFMPNDGYTIEQVLDEIKANDSYLNNLQHGLKVVNVSLPKFKIEKEIDNLPVTLQKLGINKLFSDKADLSGIIDKKTAGIDMMQNSVITVDENGTEAAAITGVIWYGAPESIDFVANRPFIFFIRERSTNAILFSGIVNSL